MIAVKSKKFYTDHLPPGLPVFYQPFYLDAVTKGNWEASCLCDDDDKVLACMPYALSQTTYNIIRQPPLTIYQGPFFTEEYRHKISLNDEMELLEALESSFLPYDYYNQNWHPSSRNWLPFYWKGYHQSTRYTYIIPGPRDIETIRTGYNENVRRNIKKSSANIRIEETSETEGFFGVVQKTFDRKNEKQPYDLTIFKGLIQSCFDQKCCTIYLARDTSENLHGGMFIIWDSKWVYYMAGGIDEGFKKSGAMSLLFGKAIEFAMRTGRSFDFGGSMIEPIEKFFRSFGAVQQEYFVVTKVKSPVLRIRLALGKFHSAFSPL